MDGEITYPEFLVDKRSDWVYISSNMAGSPDIPRPTPDQFGLEVILGDEPDLLRTWREERVATGERRIAKYGLDLGSSLHGLIEAERDHSLIPGSEAFLEEVRNRRAGFVGQLVLSASARGRGRELTRGAFMEYAEAMESLRTPSNKLFP